MPQYRFLQFLFSRGVNRIDRTDEAPYQLGAKFFFRHDGNFCFMDTWKANGNRPVLALSEDGKRLSLTDDAVFTQVDTDSGDASYRGMREVACDDILAAHFEVDGVTITVVPNPDVYRLNPDERLSYVNPHGLFFTKEGRSVPRVAYSFADDS